MPLHTQAAVVDETDRVDERALLFKEDGSLTSLGDVVEDFWSQVDFSDFASDADVAEFVQEEKLHVRYDGDQPIDCQPGDDGAFEAVLEAIPGVVVAHLIDEDDLYGLWKHYVGTLPSESLEEKIILQQVLPYLEEGDLDEFARGQFRKIRKQGAQGKNKVTRMLLAMIHKEAIKRVKKGSGYKKGDYAPAPTTPWKFYPKGSKGGLAKVSKMRAKLKGKQKSLQAKSGTKTVMKATPATGGAKAAKKASAKKALFGGGAKAKQVASVMPGGRPVLNESLLAGAALKNMRRRGPQQPMTKTLTEAAR